MALTNWASPTKFVGQFGPVCGISPICGTHALVSQTRPVPQTGLIPQVETKFFEIPKNYNPIKPGQPSDEMQHEKEGIGSI